MSISSEISRIKKAKEDIITAIQSKGVNVDSNAKIDTLPNMISSIETGSGSGFTINGGKSVRINNSGGDIGAGSLIGITDTASAVIGEVKTDFTHTFDQFTNLIMMPENGLDYGAIVTPYPYTITDYGLLVEYCHLTNEYEPIKKFLTPILFKLGANTNILALKQCIHPATLSPSRFVLAIFGSYTAEGVALTNYQIRILVFDFDFPYKSYGVENAKMTMIDQLFTFDSNAYMTSWTNQRANGCYSSSRPFYYSMVTPLNQDVFMIPVKYSTSNNNKMGIIIFKIENGSVRVVHS